MNPIPTIEIQSHPSFMTASQELEGRINEAAALLRAFSDRVVAQMDQTGDPVEGAIAAGIQNLAGRTIHDLMEAFESQIAAWRAEKQQVADGASRSSGRRRVAAA